MDTNTIKLMSRIINPVRFKNKSFLKKIAAAVRFIIIQSIPRYCISLNLKFFESFFLKKNNIDPRKEE